ncbi:MAG: hypothetical protein ACXAC7_19885 [Candidatus Hodarchaeales archaeon]
MGSDVKLIIRNIIKSERNSINDRFKKLFKLLEQTVLLDEFLSDNELQNIRDCFVEIIKLRHIVAHRMPNPDISILDDSDFSSIRNYISNNQEILNVNDTENLPEGLREIFNIVIQFFEELMPLFSLVHALPEVTAIYSAIIESIISTKSRLTD